MSLATDIVAMMADMRDALGSPTFTWNGLEVPCIPSTWNQSTTLIAGGWDESFRLRLFVDFDEWLTVDSTLVTVDSTLYTVDNDTSTPAIGRKLTYGGKTHRIVATDRDPARAYWVLILDQDDK
jgi:hypothetical protein